MNTIRFFATFVILIGVCAVIYAIQSLLYNATDTVEIKRIILFTIWGLISFTSGIGLIRAVKK